MQPKFLTKVKEGDAISAKDWNLLVDYLSRNWINLGQSTGIEAVQSSEGTALRIKDRFNRFLAIANGDIPARSGTDAGIGSVTLVYANVAFSGDVMTGVALDATGPTYDVYNPSASTMTSTNGIDSGMYCWVEEYPSGLFCVSPLECS